MSTRRRMREPAERVEAALNYEPALVAEILADGVAIAVSVLNWRIADLHGSGGQVAEILFPRDLPPS